MARATYVLQRYWFQTLGQAEGIRLHVRMHSTEGGAGKRPKKIAAGSEAAILGAVDYALNTLNNNATVRGKCMSHDKSKAPLTIGIHTGRNQESDAHARVSRP